MSRPGFVLEVDEKTPHLMTMSGAQLRLERFGIGAGRGVAAMGGIVLLAAAWALGASRIEADRLPQLLIRYGLLTRWAPAPPLAHHLDRLAEIGPDAELPVVHSPQLNLALSRPTNAQLGGLLYAQPAEVSDGAPFDLVIVGSFVPDGIEVKSPLAAE